MKATSISIIVAGLLIGGAIMFGQGTNSDKVIEPAENVSIVDSTQIIEISAKGGYSPRVSVARAGIPSVLRIKTQGTYDCSAAVSIPRIGYRKNLPPTGEVEIEIPSQKSGTKLQGLCAMGMYYFTLKFE